MSPLLSVTPPVAAVVFSTSEAYAALSVIPALSTAEVSAVIGTEAGTGTGAVSGGTATAETNMDNLCSVCYENMPRSVLVAFGAK